MWCFQAEVHVAPHDTESDSDEGPQTTQNDNNNSNSHSESETSKVYITEKNTQCMILLCF